MQKRKISILVISHEYPPLGGGAGRVLRALCEELHVRGFAVTLWTGAPAKGQQEHFPYAVHYFKTGRTVRFQTNKGALLSFLFQVIFRGLVRPVKQDLVFSNIAIPAGIAGSIFHKLFRVPHIIWLHGADVHADRSQGANIFWRFILRRICKNASICCFVSKSLADLARVYGITGPMEILPVIPDAKPPIDVSPLPESRMFLFAGRMEQVKNPLLFIEAIDIFLHDGKFADVNFRIVGSGRLFDSVRKRINGLQAACVLLKESADGEEMARLYAQAYALVIPSRAEGFPLTILEAADRGVPAIGSDTIGVKEAIHHRDTGLLFKNEDAQSLAEAMLLLASDSALRNRLGQNAKVFARQFTASHCADVFEGLVETVL
jgi:glycosyltransferase involved in cell wall biosynthesis